MTKEQIELVRELISAINDGDSRRESNLILKLRLTALDAQVKGADWHDHHPAYPQDSTGTPQVKTTTTTSGSVFPPAPSTPQPVGFNYKQENYVQSLKDSLGKMINEMAADIHKKDKTIEMLKTRLDSANSHGQNLTNKLMAEQSRCVELQKRVESLSTVLDDGRVERGSLSTGIENQTNEIHKQATEIAALKKKIEDLYKVIDEMAKQKPVEGDCERAIIALELLTADLARMDRRASEKNILINQLHASLNKRGEAMTKLSEDNKKLSEALNKMSDNVAKLRHEKDSMEQGYIKKLTAKSLRIGILKEAGTALYRELKTMYPACHIRVSDMLKKWEDEAL